jgi:hypothetical protein
MSANSLSQQQTLLPAHLSISAMVMTQATNMALTADMLQFPMVTMSTIS